MVKEEYVSYEVAKLLKEKGFVTPCNWLYCSDGTFGYRNSLWDKEMFPAPTHQMAMKWLRENHNILITIIPQEIKVGIDTLCYGIYRITEDLYQPLYNGKVDNLVDSYEECVEAALKYSLENLI